MSEWPSRRKDRGEPTVRILVVEDEAKVARALEEGLEAEHYEVVASATGEDGFFQVNAVDNGLEVTALHNYFFFDRPHVYKAALDTQQK